MASIAPPTFSAPSTRTDRSPSKWNFTNPKYTSQLKRTSSGFNSHSLSSTHLLARFYDSTLCRCRSEVGGDDDADAIPLASESSSTWRWDSVIPEAVKNAVKKFDDYVNSYRDQSVSVEVEEGEREVMNGDEEWDWERWRQHFSEIDDQERIVSVLKAQLARAITKEDYEDAARLKVAIAASATNDTVGRVMSHLNKAVEDERYGDAAFIRDSASAGLVGWWAGMSEDTDDPYGRIIRINAEHGRYVARSYSPRQLATATDGAPLFEIFLTVNEKGEFKQQAVYLKRKMPRPIPISSSKLSGATSSLDSLSPTENKPDLFDNSIEDLEDGEEKDDDSGFGNMLRDMNRMVEVKVLKVLTPSKLDKDILSNMVEQMMEEEDEDNDFDMESDDTEDEIKDESDEELNEIELDANGTGDAEEQSQIAFKVVIGGAVNPNGAHHRDIARVPAKLEKKNRVSFTFTIVEDNSEPSSGSNRQSPGNNKKAKHQIQRSMDKVMLDLAKSIGKGRIPMKVLKDVSELLTFSINQAQTHQPLSRSTTFNRIDTASSSDPLKGLYVGAHGLYSSEVIQLRRRFGHWKEEGRAKGTSNIEFYEYVEAVKLTGDPYVPAGQIAFRAKVGKKYQLPHKGIIPEEFGVIARYKGQGRLAEPGFRNPRWVDGELVILDGKYIKGGPVVGFVYWAPEYHFLVFFHRLKLEG